MNYSELKLIAFKFSKCKQMSCVFLTMNFKIFLLKTVASMYCIWRYKHLTFSFHVFTNGEPPTLTETIFLSNSEFLSTKLLNLICLEENDQKQERRRKIIEYIYQLSMAFALNYFHLTQL